MFTQIAPNCGYISGLHKLHACNRMITGRASDCRSMVRRSLVALEVDRCAKVQNRVQPKSSVHRFKGRFSPENGPRKVEGPGRRVSANRSRGAGSQPIEAYAPHEPGFGSVSPENHRFRAPGCQFNPCLSPCVPFRPIYRENGTGGCAECAKQLFPD